MAERIKRPITYRNPVIDATLLDGSRINIVYGTAISRHGSNFTIRKVNEVPLSILNIVESNGIDYLAAAYLWICVEYGMSLFVSGETASGKTTLLNAITDIHPSGEQDCHDRRYTRTECSSPQLDPRSCTCQGKRGRWRGRAEKYRCSIS